jgi:hypothetical protein
MRVVESIFPRVILLEKQKVEARRQPQFRIALIEPNLGRHHFIRTVIGLAFIWLSENDVVASSVGTPPRSRGFPAQHFVCMLYPAVVLGPELVFQGHAIGIASLPERIDEPDSSLHGLEIEKELALFVSDDVDDLFLDPLTMRVRELLHPFVGRKQADGEGQGDYGRNATPG